MLSGIAKNGGAVLIGRWSCPAGRREAGASDVPAARAVVLRRRDRSQGADI